MWPSWPNYVVIIIIIPVNNIFFSGYVESGIDELHTPKAVKTIDG